MYVATPSLGLRSCGLSDLEEDEEEAVSMSFPEWQGGRKRRRRKKGINRKCINRDDEE